MGGMLPTAAMSALQLGMDAAQQQAAQGAAKSEARAQTRQLQQAYAAQSQARQDQLRRALATQRARFGAQGLTAGSGSSEAVISGIEGEAQQEDAADQNALSLRVNKISDDLGWQNRRSLLAASTPAYRSAFSLVQRSLRSVPLLGGE